MESVARIAKNNADYDAGWNDAKQGAPAKRFFDSNDHYDNGYHDFCMQPQFEPCYSNDVECDEDEL